MNGILILFLLDHNRTISQCSLQLVGDMYLSYSGGNEEESCVAAGLAQALG